MGTGLSFGTFIILGQMRDRQEQHQDRMEDMRERSRNHPHTPYTPKPWSLDDVNPAYSLASPDKRLEFNLEAMGIVGRDRLTPGTLDSLNEHLLQVMCLENRGENRARYSAFTPERIETAAAAMGTSVEDLKNLVNEVEFRHVEEAFSRFSDATNPQHAEWGIAGFDRALTDAAAFRARFDGDLAQHRLAILDQMGLSEEFVADTKAGMDQRYVDRVGQLIDASPGCDGTRKDVTETFNEVNDLMKYLNIDYQGLGEVLPEAQDGYGRLAGMVYEGSPLPRDAGSQQDADETLCPYPRSGAGTYKVPNYPDKARVMGLGT